MAGNAIALIQKYATKAWDEVYVAESRSAILDGEKDFLKFTGTKTVKVAKYQGAGLKNYGRANVPVEGRYAAFDSQDIAGGFQGSSTASSIDMDPYGYGYPVGDMALTWEEFTISVDRAIQLRIELMDDEETDGLAVAMALKETNRVQVVPEVDAFVFSKLAANAGLVNTTAIAAPVAGQLGYTVNGPIYHLNLAFEALDNAEVPAERQVIFCSTSFRNALRNTNELIRAIDPSEKREGVKYSIEEYEGRKLITVPNSRFRTDVQLLNTGNGGYTFGGASQQIDFIVCDPSKIAHVVKYEHVKTFGPGVVQDFDGYKINVRIYHDLFVLDNKRVGVYVHTSNVAAVAPDLKFEHNSTANIISATWITPNRPGVLMTELYAIASASVPSVGTSVASLSGEIKITPYANLAALGLSANTAYKLFGAHDGVVTIASSEAFTTPA